MWNITKYAWFKNAKPMLNFNMICINRYYNFINLIIFLCFFSGCSSPSSRDLLQLAKDDLLKRNCMQVLKRLEKPFNLHDDNQSRLIIRAMALAWMEQYEEAAKELNIFINSLPPQTQIKYIYPRHLANTKESPIREEFDRKTFSADDMRYLWRVLWQYRIANRVTNECKSDMEKTTALLDFVYRHTRFDTVEQHHIKCKPFHTLILGQGLCDDLSWTLNMLLRSVSVPTLRLILHKDPNKIESSHTLSAVNIDNHWIPVDASYGIIVQDPESAELNGIPKYFKLNPSQESLEKLDMPLPEWEPYLNELENYGKLKELKTDISNYHPFIDYEGEACMPRFLILANRTKRIFSLPTLGSIYPFIVIPKFDPKSRVISNWRAVNIQYIFNLSREINEAQRTLAKISFGHLKFLQHGRMLLLDGKPDQAETEFLKILDLNKDLPPDAKIDLDYYLALCAYEKEDYAKAYREYEEFIQKHPRSSWVNRVQYQMALIAHAQNREDDWKSLINECNQNNMGALFQWSVKYKIGPTIY